MKLVQQKERRSNIFSTKETIINLNFGKRLNTQTGLKYTPTKIHRKVF